VIRETDVSTKITLKHDRDEASGGWFHLYQECLDEDDGFVYLELGGVPFETATSIDLSGKGLSRVAVRIPSKWARKLGLIEPIKTGDGRHGHDQFERIKSELGVRRYRAEEIPAISACGVYGFYLEDPAALAGIEVGSSGLLYIGMTEESLEYRNHFGHTDSAFSSLRRSLGAILKQDLELVAIPRGSGQSPKDMANYRFAGGGEEQLTDWMAKHLRYSFVVVEEEIEQVEQELIQDLRPPLNLADWENPQKNHVMRLRAACRDEAARSTDRP
jgi:hypothetical protein